jgi:hypothetical protein
MPGNFSSQEYYERPFVNKTVSWAMGVVEHDILAYSLQ